MMMATCLKAHPMTKSHKHFLTIPLLILTSIIVTVHADDDQKVAGANSNALLLEYKGKIKISASTHWPTWPAAKAIDGNTETSWFSDRDDAAALGTKPWLEIELPADETVRRVTLFGNREKKWLNNYSILEGVIQFFDKDRKRLWADESKAAGDKYDFDFRPNHPVNKVRYIRFTSTKDEGEKNHYESIALGEILVE